MGILCVAQEDLLIKGCSSPLHAAHASGAEKRAEFTPQLTSPKFLAGLAIWHFLMVLTARLGNDV